MRETALRKPQSSKEMVRFKCWEFASLHPRKSQMKAVLVPSKRRRNQHLLSSYCVLYIMFSLMSDVTERQRPLSSCLLYRDA
jgi:hypothetical protein